MGSHKWLENTTFAGICTDTRIIMQDQKRLTFKIDELMAAIDRQLIDYKIDKNLEETPPDVFISYCWKNSHEAIKKGTKTNTSSLGD